MGLTPHHPTVVVFCEPDLVIGLCDMLAGKGASDVTSVAGVNSLPGLKIKVCRNTPCVIDMGEYEVIGLVRANSPRFHLHDISEVHVHYNIF